MYKTKNIFYCQLLHVLFYPRILLPSALVFAQQTGPPLDPSFALVMSPLPARHRPASEARSDARSSPASFRTSRFALDQPEDWRDQSVYLLSGPTVDNLTHTLGITIDPNPVANSLSTYADAQIQAATDALREGTLLLHDRIPLANGDEAVRAVYRWQTPTRPLFQQHLFVYTEDGALVLGAPFTRRSRRLLGTQVQTMMCSVRLFSPANRSAR
jgi:hypothetical protein